MFNLGKWLVLVLGLALVAGAGCEKDSKKRGSGALTADEQELLGHLPGRAHLLFGADGGRLMEHWDGSPLDRAMKSLAVGQMASWLECWKRVGDVDMAGSLELAGAARARGYFVMRGLSRPELERCAAKLHGVTLRTERDGRYVELAGMPDGSGGTHNPGYYFVTDDICFTGFDVGLTADMESRHAGVEDLEGALARARQQSVLQNDRLAKRLPVIDRSRGMWFVGDAQGILLADGVREGQLSVGIGERSTTLEFSVELTEASQARQMVRGLNAIRDDKVALPAGNEVLGEVLVAILKQSRLRVDGSTLRGRLVVDHEQMEALLSAMPETGVPPN